ncbi:MAG TPA: family 43 glycosylhydrolase [Bacteriovoracaceae bacterium]|nr:family 43 glycosylhydrolase [Bacteriovoracaceae bacterium]
MLKSILLFVFLFTLKAALGHERVMDHDFPDPTLIKASDGWYYAYATQGMTEATVPKLLNIQLARSRDLKSWQHLGDALPNKPSWAKTTQSLWAPHIHFANDRYYLYYSADPDTRDGICLAVAVSSSPRGPFVDSGKPLACGHTFSFIDPMVYDDPQTGKPLLYWGSGFEPIRVRPLDSTLINFEPQSKALELVAPDKGPSPAPYTRLLEGAWMLKHEGFFYLFVSGEDCCGTNPKYSVLVLRSLSPTGPFQWRNNDPKQSVVIQSQGHFIATGHNAFIHDHQGQLWSFHHGIDKEHPLLLNPIPGDRINRRILLRTKVDFLDGWPVSH